MNKALSCHPTALSVVLFEYEKYNRFTFKVLPLLSIMSSKCSLKCLIRRTAGVWLWRSMWSLHYSLQTGSGPSSLFSSEYCGLFSCIKLITYLNLVVRLGVGGIVRGYQNLSGSKMMEMIRCKQKEWFELYSLQGWSLTLERWEW